MKSIKVFDATLRDGSHAVKHQLTESQIREYCKSIDNAGMDAVIVGHGNGLGASSLQIGLSLLSDYEMLKVAKENLKRTKLGTYMLPGFGTIKDDINPALEIGVDVFKIGCHCTEADITKQHIEYLARKGKEVYGVLMMCHMASPSRLLEESEKMQGYGAKGVILMDSAGALTPEMVKNIILTLKESLNIEIGFHAHNNLGLAVSNTYLALQEGATIVDGTIRGFGAGAGNCPLEVLIALLIKERWSIPREEWYRLLNTSDNIVKYFIEENNNSTTSIVSGVAGVFSGFKIPVINIAKEFGVDARDIFFELGRLKVVAGQEDMIIDVASELQRKKILDQSFSF